MRGKESSFVTRLSAPGPVDWPERARMRAARDWSRAGKRRSLREGSRLIGTSRSPFIVGWAERSRTDPTRTDAIHRPGGWGLGTPRPRDVVRRESARLKFARGPGS